MQQARNLLIIWTKEERLNINPCKFEVAFTKRNKLEVLRPRKLRREEVQLSEEVSDTRPQIVVEPTSTQVKKEGGGSVDADQTHPRKNMGTATKLNKRPLLLTR